MAKKATTAPVDTPVSTGVLNENKNEVDTSTKTKSKVTTRKSVTLEDSEEIEVISLIPHVSYLDKHTQDMYEWDEVGHSEFMTVETLKDMWKSNKGYFRNLWLKPLDERVLVKFGLVKLFEEYEFLMDESSYTKDNLDKILETVATTPLAMRFAVVNKIKQLVSDGDISDVSIIKALGNKLDVDFIAFT